MGPDDRTSVVVLTHERPLELLHVLARLHTLSERPAIVVVDNASRTDIASLSRRRYPDVRVVRCPRDLGAAGRNAGVACVTSPYVGFCDDDTWWAPGALQRAADLLDAHADLAAVAARVRVGPLGREDPACAAMARSPLEARGLPGPAIASFMAGAVVMRTAAFHAAGGYEPRLFLGAEEWLMALDLAALGWRIVFAADVVAHRLPSRRGRDTVARWTAEARNHLWVACMRLPPRCAWREARRALAEAARRRVLWPALCQAVAGLPWALRRRRVVPARVVALIEQARRAP